MFDSLLSGAAFGAALAASGMYEPSVILSQMKLENWHSEQPLYTDFLPRNFSRAIWEPPYTAV